MFLERSYKSLPCYTGDVSGACSALYELGGMVVIHDPSGCNSTYNTHDEIRWYEKDSLIYISGFSERDAILGRDEKLINETASAAMALNPAFIALLSSPVPTLNGTDFAAIARILTKKTGIVAFPVTTNGMHDYVTGAGETFKVIVERFTEPAETLRRSVNILGMTPLDFAAASSVDSIKKILNSAGWSVCSCWAMDSGLDELSQAARAEVNLVISATGLKAAKLMYEKYGIPYVVGAPVGDFIPVVMESLEIASNDGKNQFPVLERNFGDDVILIGEPVTMSSLACAIEKKYGLHSHLLCPLEVDPLLLKDYDKLVKGEAEVKDEFERAKIIVADPFYARVSPDNAKFYPLAHFAFSGRNHLAEVKDFFVLDV